MANPDLRSNDHRDRVEYWLKEIAEAMGAGGGGTTFDYDEFEARVKAALEAATSIDDVEPDLTAIIGLLTDLLASINALGGSLPTESFAGTTPVNATGVSLPAHPLQRGVHLKLQGGTSVGDDNTEWVTVSTASGNFTTGLRLYPGETVFLQIADTSTIRLFSNSIDYDTVNVFWWAS